MVADGLAARKPAHERAEPRERGREIVLVEAGDGGRDLRLVVARPQPRSPRVDTLGGVLVTLPLQQRALQQQPVVALLLEDGIEAVPRREVLRVEDQVGAHLVVRVAARRLRCPEGLLRLAPGFTRGEAIVGGALVPAPLHLRIGGRITPEGGGDVPATWASPPD